MIYKKAKSLSEALSLKQKHPKSIFFSGGSDISVSLKKSKAEGLIDISHLPTLQGIDEGENSISIGALTTINTMLESEVIQKRVPLLHSVCKTFASHQIRNIATLGGNVINDSPVADMIAPLLVLKAKIVLYCEDGEKTMPLEDIFDDYKSLSIKNGIVCSFTMEYQKGDYYYRKVGLRERLNITKLSLSLLKDKENFILSGASLNPYVKRFVHLENLLSSGIYDRKALMESILKDTDPHSQKEYKRRVLLNMIEEALESLKK